MMSGFGWSGRSRPEGAGGFRGGPLRIFDEVTRTLKEDPSNADHA